MFKFNLYKKTHSNEKLNKKLIGKSMPLQHKRKTSKPMSPHMKKQNKRVRLEVPMSANSREGLAINRCTRAFMSNVVGRVKIFAFLSFDFLQGESSFHFYFLIDLCIFCFFNRLLKLIFAIIMLLFLGKYKTCICNYTLTTEFTVVIKVWKMICVSYV